MFIGFTCVIHADAEDFDVDKGFAGKEWEGEDEGLDLSVSVIWG